VVKKDLASVPDDDPLAAAYAAACLYHLQDLSQQEVAERLKVSRSTVSRLLREARRTGIVEIHVRAPAAASGLADAVRDALGVRGVLVSPGGDDPAARASMVGEALRAAGPAAGGVLLVAWGRATWEIARQRLPSLPGVVVVPAVGGMSQPQEWFHTNEIVRKIARTLDGTARALHAPVAPSAVLLEALREDPETADTLAAWDAAEVALVGIGAPPRLLGDYGPMHVPRTQDLLERAVGDVATRYFDAAGDPVDYPGEETLLAVSRKQLQRIPTVIAVAGGEHKVPSIRGAAKAGLVDVLITDNLTARLLVGEAPEP
jgi:DNA-binding transcriptional regulator LsrR (DeoR family)